MEATKPERSAFMNRRDMFKAVADEASGAGVIVKASAIEAEPKPALAVFEVDKCVSQETCARIIQLFEHQIAGTPLAGTKAIVLSDGLKLTLLDADGHVLNRTIEGE